MIKLTIYMEPVGKARARTVRRGAKIITYTPDKTTHAENLIRDKVMDIGEKFDHGTPIQVTATFYRTRPKSVKAKVLYPTSRPDIDNFMKLLLDSLEGFAYDNDSQITTVLCKKRFGAPPRIELMIQEEKEL